MMTQRPYLPPKKTKSEKLVRELKRVWRQLTYPLMPAWGHVTRMTYDAKRAKAVRVVEGAQPVHEEIAVLLIYQPSGLCESTYWQIDWMAARGISTVVVSNAPISDGDRTRLSAVSHLVIERPNIGYDFGGYREGVMQLMERGLSPRALYVMNDSMWFPLTEDCDVIDRSRAAPEDVWGLFIDLDWRLREGGNLEGTHIQSYFFRFSGKVLADRRFWTYWRKMSLINSKRIVIQLRELKLAGYFQKLGYRIGGLNNWLQIMDYLLMLDDEEMMADILRHQSRMNAKETPIIQPYLDEGKLTALQIRDALRQDIRDTKVFGYSTALHPYVTLAVGLPFLKKARIPVMIAKRLRMVELGLHKQFDDPVRTEVEGWDAR